MTDGDAPALHRRDLDPDPIAQLGHWLSEAGAAIALPEAACLATIGRDGNPDARMVLLKGLGPDGMRFYTNRESQKGQQIHARPEAAMVLYWPASPERQVRIRGSVEELPAADADAYFAGRPRDSQLGAWASPQSRVLAGREELEQAFAEAESRFEGGPVPRPEHWIGYLLVPAEIEFWQGRPARVHDRFRYQRAGDAPGGWLVERLAP
jgi:pyridoxamine 5'-phosphate oxidase